MAGTLIPLFRKGDYVFNVINGTTNTSLVPLVDVQNATSAVLLWRIYALTITTGSFYLVLKNVMMGPDDPGTILVSPTDVIAQQGSTANQLLAPSITGPIGKYLQVLARTTGGATGTVTVTMAADLLVRDS
jgi:hypothetical protein